MSVTYHLLHNLLLSSQSHLSPFPVLQSYWKVYNSLKHAHHYSLHTFKHSFPLQKSLYDRYLCLCGRPICPLTYILFETFHEPPLPQKLILAPVSFKKCTENRPSKILPNWGKDRKSMRWEKQFSALSLEAKHDGDALLQKKKRRLRLYEKDETLWGFCFKANSFLKNNIYIGKDKNIQLTHTRTAETQRDRQYQLLARTCNTPVCPWEDKLLHHFGKPLGPSK